MEEETSGTGKRLAELVYRGRNRKELSRERHNLDRIKQWFCFLVATAFGLGKSPWAPGTVGSLFALALVWFAFPAQPLYQGALISAVFVLGILTSRCRAATLGKKDPSEVVIDEVVGVFVTFFWLPNLSVWVLIIGFLLFRLFDITKPLLVGKADRMGGAMGIMLDDVIAGIFANVILQCGLRLV